MQQRGIFSLLALTTVGSLTIAAGSVLALGPEDKITVPRGFFILCLGFIFFLSLFDFLNHVALQTASGLKIRKKYQLTMYDVFDISNKVVSAVQAALSCAAGSIVCLWSCTRSFLHSSHFMSEAYAWFGAAYFFYDIWSMYKVHINIGVPSFTIDLNQSKSNGNDKKYTEKGYDTRNMNGGGDKKNGVSAAHSEDSIYLENGPKKPKQSVFMSFMSYCVDQPLIILHHLFIGGFGFLVIVYLRGGLGDCVFGFVYLMELSTPFVSLRSILSRLKLKTSQLYVINGVVMLITFFFCRIVMMPYLCHIYSKSIGLPYWQAINALPTGCKISIAILLFPQFYWFYLMLVGASKIFCTSSKSKKSKHESVAGSSLSATSKKPLVGSNGSSAHHR